MFAARSLEVAQIQHRAWQRRMARHGRRHRHIAAPAGSRAQLAARPNIPLHGMLRTRSASRYQTRPPRPSNRSNRRSGELRLPSAPLLLGRQAQLHCPTANAALDERQQLGVVRNTDAQVHALHAAVRRRHVEHDLGVPGRSWMISRRAPNDCTTCSCAGAREVNVEGLAGRRLVGQCRFVLRRRSRWRPPLLGTAARRPRLTSSGSATAVRGAAADANLDCAVDLTTAERRYERNGPCQCWPHTLRLWDAAMGARRSRCGHAVSAAMPFACPLPLPLPL